MSNYEVGHGKPPKATQFKPGASGNPRGRPKGAKNVDDEIFDLLTAPVTINQNGKPTKMTPIAIAIKKLIANVASGDTKSIKILLDLRIAHAKAQTSNSDKLLTAGSSFDLTAEELESISKEMLLKDTL